MSDKVYCLNCAPNTAGLKVTLGQDYGATATSLPPADFLVITWVDHETGALASVLGCGKYHFDSLSATGNNFTRLKMKGQPMPEGMDCQGYFIEVMINGKSVICFSSNFHPKFSANDASQTQAFYKAIAMKNNKPNYGCIITSGTAGGVWSSMDVGDVAISVKARYGLLVKPASLSKLPVYTSAMDIIGNSTAPGGGNWFDYANKQYLAKAACVTGGLLSTGGRTKKSQPLIYYQETKSNILCTITDTEMSNGHTSEGLDINKYRTMGSMLEENDSFLAQAWNQIGFENWVSIRNVSDLPTTKNAEQYTQFGYCSSINGAYAVWAFIMGH